MLCLHLQKRHNDVRGLEFFPDKVSAFPGDVRVLFSKYHDQFTLPSQITPANFDETVVTLALTESG